MSVHTEIWTQRPRPPARSGDDGRHSLHRVVSRICTLPPRLASHLVSAYSSLGDTVLDPFCGKGTIPLQACLEGRVGIGGDISPEAVCSARAAVRAPSIRVVENTINAVAHEVAATADDGLFAPDDVALFYDPSTLRSLLKWRRALSGRRGDAADFVRGVLLGILHGKGEDFLSIRCSHSYSMSPGYVRSYVEKNGLKARKKLVGACILSRARQLLSDGPPLLKGRIWSGDARSLPLREESVDLALTSPPYFSVHRYARDNWLRLWFLGYADYREIQRKLIQTSNLETYSSAMRSALSELHRVLKPKKLALILVGDVRLKRASGSILIKTAELFADLAEQLGFRCEAVLRDSIPKKYKVAGYLSSDGGIRTERLIVLRRR